MFEVSEFFHILDCIINSNNMQKTPFTQLIREELTRALVFGVGLFTVLALGFV